MYETIFTVLNNQSFTFFEFLGGLTFKIMLFLIFIKYGKYINYKKKPPSKIFNMMIFVFLVFFILIDISAYISQKNMRLKKLYLDKNYSIANGIVKNYIKGYDRNDGESEDSSFFVNNINFKFNERVHTGGFHQEGILYEGAKVKIFYTDNKKVIFGGYNRLILRLDIQRRK